MDTEYVHNKIKYLFGSNLLPTSDIQILLNDVSVQGPQALCPPVLPHPGPHGQLPVPTGQPKLPSCPPGSQRGATGARRHFFPWLIINAIFLHRHMAAQSALPGSSPRHTARSLLGAEPGITAWACWIQLRPEFPFLSRNTSCSARPRHRQRPSRFIFFPQSPS